MTATEHRDPHRGDVGPGLREVIDAIWCPRRTGVTVGLGRVPTTAPRVETYVVLPHPRHPRLLLPAGDMASARRALRAYRGLRTVRAEAWSRLIRATVLSSAPASGLLHRLDVHAEPAADRLLPRLSALSGHPAPLRAMLAVRRPEPTSKPTLGLVDRDGNPVCYAKLGRSVLTDAMVRNEAATLRRLTGRLPTIVTPVLVAETEWQGHPVAVVAPLPADSRRLTTEPLQMAHTLWEVAASGDLSQQALAGSTYQERLQLRLEACARSRPDVSEPLLRWSRRLSDAPGTLRFGRSHGDWVSWNLGVHEGRVVVWDWELSVPDAPVGFDACHWYFQRARASDGLAAAAAAVDAVEPGLVRMGVSAADTATVAGLYVLDAFVAVVESSLSAGSEADLSTVATLAWRRVGR